jgi:cytochrome P450
MARGCPRTQVLYDSDGPEYARLRVLVDAALSAQVVASLEPIAGAVASELVNDVVAPFADRTILDFVGVPLADHAQVRLELRLDDHVHPGQLLQRGAWSLTSGTTST